MPAILVFRKLRLEGHKFKVNLNCTRRRGRGGGSRGKRGEGIVGEAGKGGGERGRRRWRKRKGEGGGERSS